MSQILHFYLKFKFPQASCIFFGKFGSPKLWDSWSEACKSWQERSASSPAKHTYTVDAPLGPCPFATRKRSQAWVHLLSAGLHLGQQR